MNNIDEKSQGKQGLSVPTGAGARAILKQLYHAAISAVQPSNVLKKKVRILDSILVIEGESDLLRLPLTGKVYVVGAGKGVDLTAPLWRRIFGPRLEAGVLLVRDRLLRGPSEPISVVIGGHPLPDERSLAGTERCLQLLRRTRRNDCVVFFLMGGASSLLARPALGLALEDKRKVTELLLKSGVAISEINCVRKHLSSVKAGGMLRYAYPARVVTLAISDVLGDDPTVIGSAPTYYDPTSYRDAWRVLARYGLQKKIPKKARDYLLQGVRGEIPESLKSESGLSNRGPYILLANNIDALSAAQEEAKSLGFSTTILTSELSGDTATKARELCSLLKRIANGTGKYRHPHCFLLGGETTVRVRGKGTGGRNQEFALVSAMELCGRADLHFLSAGSDGSDGPTNAAGAFVDGNTISRARTLGLDPHLALRNNDSHPFFTRLGDLFCPGPTGTNVLDLKIILLY